MIIAVLVFVPGSDADAKVYKYKDENGKVHFTDDPSKVPTKYRKSSKMKERAVRPSKSEAYETKVKDVACERYKHKSKALHDAAKNNRLAEARKILSKNADLEAKDRGCYTPLHWAAQKNHLRMVKLLISKGADVNALGEVFTPLHLASRYGNKEIVGFLVKKGADVNIQSALFNNTPLMQAAYNGHIPIIELLLSKGANVNSRDTKEQTALGIALKEGYEKAAKILRRHGAR
jgi:ankyrin repeat protein